MSRLGSSAPSVGALWGKLLKRVGQSLSPFLCLWTIGLHYLRQTPGERDYAMTAAVLADLTGALRMHVCRFLALRALARIWPGWGLGQVQEGGRDAEATRAYDLRFAHVMLKAGRVADALRLAEHLGAWRDGQRPPPSSPGLMAAAMGPETLTCAIPFVRVRLPMDLPMRLLFGAASALSWLPRRVGATVFAVVVFFGLAIIDSLYRVDDPSAGARALRLSFWQRFAPAWGVVPRLRDPGPVTGVRLTLFAGDLGVMFVVRSPRLTCAGYATDLPLPGRREPLALRPAGIADALFGFHSASRAMTAAELSEPGGLLHQGAATIAPALARLPVSFDRRLLVLRTPGLVGHIPYAGLTVGGRRLIDDFDIVHDDGVNVPTGARGPIIAAFWGGSDLPSARNEVAMVRERALEAGFGVIDAREADPTALTVEALKRALASASVVHLATHFRAHPHDPALTQISLAGGAWSDIGPLLGEGAGVDLVFLSGCETGAATDDLDGAGTDGAAPWRQAGARSVVSTLWRVSDAPAARLADRFYQELFAGATRAGALARAQSALARRHGGVEERGERFFDVPGDVTDGPSEDEMREPHPRSWAGYRLTGEWRALPGVTEAN